MTAPEIARALAMCSRETTGIAIMAKLSPYKAAQVGRDCSRVSDASSPAGFITDRRSHNDPGYYRIYMQIGSNSAGFRSVPDAAGH
jgi:hypothetical protein